MEDNVGQEVSVGETMKPSLHPDNAAESEADQEAASFGSGHVMDVAGEEISPPVIESDAVKDNKANDDNNNNVINESSSKCCSLCRFGGVKIAQGYNVLGTGRGCLIMSNIFLATALTYLAAESVGCIPDEECEEKVFGLFRPASLITNIAVIWGVLAALFMPVIGAIIDYTPHRWKVGVGSAAVLIVIQLVQIGTSSTTWVYMAMLQALSGFLYQIQNLTSYAYLPDVARTVGEEKITQYVPTFTMVQFSSQGLFLLVVIGFSLALGFGDVGTARLSQIFNACTVSTSFYFGWKLLPQVPARHSVPEGKHMLTQGFVQNWTTAKEINLRYKKGLRWFLLTVVFGEAAANAFTIVSVVFLDERLGLSGNEVGIFFFVALIGMIPGGKLAEVIASRTNPKISWCLSMMVLFVVTTLGALLLDTDNALPYSFVWGFVIGVNLGWFYPTEGMILSMCVPEGKEAEISGFFVYCTQILGWLPPLVFSLLVEADVDQGVGVMCISSFFLIAIATMSMSASWEEILAEVGNSLEDADDNIKQAKRRDSTEYSKTEFDTATSLPPSEANAKNEATSYDS